MKNKFTVELCDKEYSLLWDEPEDYVKSIVAEMNKMINNMAFNNMRVSKSDAIILTCLDLCDKNRKLTENNDHMRKQIMMHVDEIAMLNKRLMAYERQKSAKNLKNLSIEMGLNEDDDENDVNKFESAVRKKSPNA